MLFTVQQLSEALESFGHAPMSLMFMFIFLYKIWLLIYKFVVFSFSFAFVCFGEEMWSKPNH